MCFLFSVSTSGYYSWVIKKDSDRKKKNMIMADKIKQIFYKSRQTYGVQRIKAVLLDENVTCCKHRICRLMRQEKLIAKARKKFKATTNSKHKLPVADNLLSRNLNTK